MIIKDNNPLKQSYRLNQALVLSGLSSSRRKADSLVTSGQVYLDGKKINSLNFKVRNSELSKLKVGSKTGTISSPIIVLLNKPKGYVCSHSKTDKGQIIFSLLPQRFRNYKISGRLDKNSSGLVVLSNQALSFSGLEKYPKEYEVLVDKSLSELDQNKMLSGLMINGKLYQVKSIVSLGAKSYKLELISGYYHQIKVMFDRLGFNIRSIHRTSVGPYKQSMLTGKRFKLVKYIQL